MGANAPAPARRNAIPVPAATAAAQAQMTIGWPAARLDGSRRAGVSGSQSPDERPGDHAGGQDRGQRLMPGLRERAPDLRAGRRPWRVERSARERAAEQHPRPAQAAEHRALPVTARRGPPARATPRPTRSRREMGRRRPAARRCLRPAEPRRAAAPRARGRGPPPGAPGRLSSTTAVAAEHDPAQSRQERRRPGRRAGRRWRPASARSRARARPPRPRARPRPRRPRLGWGPARGQAARGGGAATTACGAPAGAVAAMPSLRVPSGRAVRAVAPSRRVLRSGAAGAGRQSWLARWAGSSGSARRPAPRPVGQRRGRQARSSTARSSSTVPRSRGRGRSARSIACPSSRGSSRRWRRRGARCWARRRARRAPAAPLANGHRIDPRQRLVEHERE